MKRIVVTSLLMAGLLAFGCKGADTPAKSGEVSVAAPAVEADAVETKYYGTVKPKALTDDTLTICLGPQLKTLDPQKQDESWGVPYSEALIEGLVGYDPEDPLKVVPGVAESWETSADNMTWTFHLGKDRYWYKSGTGTVEKLRPVTAADVKVGWERCLKPEGDCSYRPMFKDVLVAGVDEYFDKLDAWAATKDEKQKKVLRPEVDRLFAQVMKGIEVVDESTLRVQLSSPSSIFLLQMGFPVFSPVYREAVEQYGDAWTQPQNIVTNGPFVLQSWQPDKIVLVKNPAYWGWNAERHGVQKITGYTPSNYEAMLQMYEQGDLDWMGIGCRVMPKMVEQYRGKVADLHINGVGANAYLTVNQVLNAGSSEEKIRLRDALRDVRVRRALGLSINRTTLVRMTKSGHNPMGTFVPLGVGGHKPADNVGFTYDLPAAKAALRDAGYPNGEGFPSFTLAHPNEAVAQLTAQIIQGFWKELGLTVQLVPKQGSQLFGDAMAHNYEISASGWIGDYPDPYTFLMMKRTGNPYNFEGWSNPAYDDLTWKAFTTPDPAKKLAWNQEAEKMLLDDAVVIPLYQINIAQLIKPYLRGLYPNASDHHPLRDVSIVRK